MGDPTRGVYQKFRVERTNDSHKPGRRHHGCRYFVLDLDHDKHAKAALEAYASSCMDEYPQLAEDLLNSLRHDDVDADHFQKLMDEEGK